jgi:ribosome-associated toxin RatA of RatAB toxin-antitoxin module
VSTVQQTIDVDVPVRTAYDQWTQFESFPRFMEGVERIDQVTDRRTHWVTRIGGVSREFDAEITEQEPDRRIAWQSVDGPRQRGIVSFEPLDDAHTRLLVQMDFEPDGVTEKVGDRLGMVERRVRGDLERFKDFVEDHGEQTEGWRGTIQDGRTVPDGGAGADTDTVPPGAAQAGGSWPEAGPGPGPRREQDVDTGLTGPSLVPPGTTAPPAPGTTASPADRATDPRTSDRPLTGRPEDLI